VLAADSYTPHGSSFYQDDIRVMPRSRVPLRQRFFFAINGLDVNQPVHFSWEEEEVGGGEDVASLPGPISVSVLLRMCLRIARTRPPSSRSAGKGQLRRIERQPQGWIKNIVELPQSFFS